MPSRTKKLRGSRTHGRGKKAGRGAGIIGGHGKAGVHKHELMRTLKYDRDHWGRHGFKRPQDVVSQPIAVNVSYLEMNLEAMRRDGYVSEDDGAMRVHLDRMGVDKVLGGGRVSTAFDVVVADSSAKAREKIESAGGQIVQPE